MDREVRPLGLFVIAIALALAAGCAVWQREKPSEQPRLDLSTRRVTPNGEIVGFVGPYGSHVWLGIPFARPPVAELRWRAPQPPAPWASPREAIRQGLPCPQVASPLGGVVEARPGEIVGDEDCLRLNVYAPPFRRGQVPTGADRRPVMVWIHGGGHTIGTAGFYDGGNLAATHDLIVVTTNYRLGPFGWFRHPALRGAGDADGSGNYGTLDVIQALRWVRENISAFGGDPENVTVFGESAGGTNVLTLLLSPEAKGLFHRAILQSAGMRTVSVAEAENYADAPEPGHRHSSREILLDLLVKDGTASDRAVARKRVAGMSDREIAEYLRAKPAAEILRAYIEPESPGMYDLPTIIRDGHVLPLEPPMERLSRPDGYNRVPVILGTNRDENKLFMYLDPTEVRQLLGFLPRLRDRDGYNMRSYYRARFWKATAVDEPAAVLGEVQGQSVYAYRWDWDEEPTILGSDLSTMIGAAHGLEIPFVFGHFDVGPEGNVFFTEENAPGRRALSARMMSYWAEFAYSGDPGRGRDGTFPRWSPWSNEPGGDTFIVLDTDSDGGIRMAQGRVTRTSVVGEVGSDPRLASSGERCALLDQLAEWWGRFSERQYATVGCGTRAIGAAGD